MTYEELWHRLAPLYDADEAKAIVRWVIDVRFGMSLAEILCGKVSELSADDQTELEKIMLRLEKGEPQQYILGSTDFCGRPFRVTPAVLIPRPETAELCHTIISSRHAQGDAQILDIGTGSGCIAITLALELPEARVTAWDISDEALAIAQENAKALGADVTFEHHDALDSSLFTLHSSLSHWDLIVSNPPYVCDKEKGAMEKNVLEHEPHLALFVPNDDPLLFYRAIAKYAVNALNPDGMLFFEINPLYADELVELLSKMPFHDIQLHQDQFGKQRFLKATKI